MLCLFCAALTALSHTQTWLARPPGHNHQASESLPRAPTPRPHALKQPAEVTQMPDDFARHHVLVWLSAVRAAQNNNGSRGGAPLVIALELSPLVEEAGPGPAEGPRANDRLM